MHKRRRLALAAGAVAALCATAAGPASANSNQESILQDERMLQMSGPAARDATLNELRVLGVDTVRLFAHWRTLAPSPRSARRPAADLSNPAAYDDWGPLDGAIAAARARGLGVILTPTGPGPRWAGRSPRAAYFRDFVAALGRRYPQVRRWAVWNEPNVSLFLYPQAKRVGGRKVPVSPRLYRNLVHAAHDGLRRSGHGRDQMMVGETAPIGHRGGNPAKTALATAWFWRSFFCLDTRGRRLRGAQARLEGCAGRYRRVPLNAASTHPYQRGGSRSPVAPDRRDEITLRTLSRLERILLQARRQGRSTNGRPPIYLTEYGVQSRPPDRKLGVPLGTQAAWINQADYVAFLRSGVRGMTQYLLRDDIPMAGFQSGLRFANGAIKPSWRAFRLPIWVVKRGRWVRVFGQARPAAPWSNPTLVLEWRGRRGGWRTIKSFVARGQRNFVHEWDRYRGGRWRLRWTAPNGEVVRSRDMAAARR